MISACHAEGPGSIPGEGEFYFFLFPPPLIHFLLTTKWLLYVIHNGQGQDLYKSDIIFFHSVLSLHLPCQSMNDAPYHTSDYIVSLLLHHFVYLFCYTEVLSSLITIIKQLSVKFSI